MAQKVKLLVTLNVPEGATVTDVRDYVREWVDCGKGSLRPPGADGPDDPGNPLWNLRPCTVRVIK